MHRPAINLNSCMLDSSGANYVRVVIDRAIHRELDYSVPENFADRSTSAGGCACRFANMPRSPRLFAVLDQSDARGIRADRSDCRRRSGTEREAARARALDEHVLLLPDRNRHAQPVSAGHSQSGGRLEKTTLRRSARPRSSPKRSKNYDDARRVRPSCSRRSPN